LDESTTGFFYAKMDQFKTIEKQPIAIGSLLLALVLIAGELSTRCELVLAFAYPRFSPFSYNAHYSLLQLVNHSAARN
jgi:hypothetical protein